MAHHHSHVSADEFTETNRAHWNDFAVNYDKDKWQKDMLNQIYEFVQTNINWIGVDWKDPGEQFESKSTSQPKEIKVLDYACGPGTMTYAIGAYATTYQGVDLAENMVKAYNTRFAEPGEQKFTAHAVTGNLLGKAPDSTLQGPEYYDFDLVTVGMGFHHFQDLPSATATLVARLRPGGIFLITDLLTHAGDYEGKESEKAKMTISHHHGFSEEDIKKLFGGAGLVEVEVKVMPGDVMIMGKSPKKVLMAKGRLPTKK